MICYISVLRVNKVMLPVKHIFSSNSFFVAVECPEVNKTAKGLCMRYCTVTFELFMLFTGVSCLAFDILCNITSQ